MKRAINQLYEKLATGALPFSDTRLGQALVDVMHMSVIVGQQTARDRIPVRAATLSYWSAVGAVPLLVLSFALAGPLGIKGATIESVRNTRHAVQTAPAENSQKAISLRVIALPPVPPRQDRRRTAATTPSTAR